MKSKLSIARLCKALTIGSDSVGTLGYIAGQNWTDADMISAVVKAAITPLDSNSGLVNDFNRLFIETVVPQTLLGKIPGLRSVPDNTRVMLSTGGNKAYWVGEGKPTPLTAGSYANADMDFYKLAAISVLTKELSRSTSRDAERLFMTELEKACAEGVDASFIDPGIAGIEGEQPPSITYNAPTIATAGNTIADIDAALAQLIKNLKAAGSDLTNAAFVVPVDTAVDLSAMRGSGGNYAYPITVNGGTLAGLPAVTTTGLQGAIVLVDGSMVAYTYGAPSIDRSEQAALQMSDTPEPGATSLVTLWQHNMTAVKVVQRANWQLLRAGMAQVMTL